MARDTDFNFTDEPIDEEQEEETGTHIDEDEDGSEAEDRGDEVTEGQGEEGDPEAEGEPEGEPDEPIDEGLLQELTGKPGSIPKARFDEVLAQNRQLLEALQAVAGARGPAAAPAPAAEQTPTFDLKAKIKERNSALLEGDEDKAADLDLEIEEYRMAEATRLAEDRAVRRVQATSDKTAADAIIADAFDKYTFLNDQSEDHNPEALEEVLMYRDHFIRKGQSLPQALQSALDKVCPQYVDETDEGEAATGKKPAAGQRDLRKVLRNAGAARRQPPETGRAGTPNRETVDTSKLDLEGMDDDAFDALPEAVKAKLRGDAG